MKNDLRMPEIIENYTIYEMYSINLLIIGTIG